MTIKNTLKITTLFLFSLVLVACGGQNKSPAPVAPVHPTLLEGTWAYKCVVDSDDPSIYDQESQTYTGDTVVQSVTSYYDPTCQKPNIYTQMTGKFTLGETVNKGAPDEYTKIDRTSQKIVVTIKDPATVKLANSNQLPNLAFGITDWKLNEPKDLTQNALAREYYDIGDTDLNIFKIDTNKFFEGDLGGDLDPTNRPTTLSKVWATRVTNKQTQTTSHESKE